MGRRLQKGQTAQSTLSEESNWTFPGQKTPKIPTGCHRKSQQNSFQQHLIKNMHSCYEGSCLGPSCSRRYKIMWAVQDFWVVCCRDPRDLAQSQWRLMALLSGSAFPITLVSKQVCQLRFLTSVVLQAPGAVPHALQHEADLLSPVTERAWHRQQSGVEFAALLPRLRKVGERLHHPARFQLPSSLHLFSASTPRPYQDTAWQPHLLGCFSSSLLSLACAGLCQLQTDVDPCTSAPIPPWTITGQKARQRFSSSTGYQKGNSRPTSNSFSEHACLLLGRAEVSVCPCGAPRHPRSLPRG